MSAKKLVYVCGSDQLRQKALEYLGETEENVIFLQSNVPVALDPYGSIVKAMLISSFKEEVKEVYIVASENDESKISEQEMWQWLEENGVEKNTANLIEYIKTPNQFSVGSWLSVGAVENTLAENLQMLQSHPLLPKTLSFHAICLSNNKETVAI